MKARPPRLYVIVSVATLHILAAAPVSSPGDAMLGPYSELSTGEMRRGPVYTG